MAIKFVTVLAAGALSYGSPSLEYTREYHGIPNPGGVCLIGVQHRYGDLLGEYLHFYDVEEERLIGPFLVTDRAAEVHAGIMEGNGLVADVYCNGQKELVSKNGLLVKLANEKYNHPDALNVVYSDTVILRVRNMLRGNHRICGGGGVRCVRQVREWIDDDGLSQSHPRQ